MSLRDLGGLPTRIAICNTVCMTQIVTRIPDDLATQLDDLVERGVVESRSEAVRQGLRRLVDDDRRAQVAQKIVDGYRRIPQDDDDGLWSDSATIAMIAEEPW